MYWIEMFYADGTPILGIGNGQALIRAVYWKRTTAFKHALACLGRDICGKTAMSMRVRQMMPPMSWVGTRIVFEKSV